MKQIQVTYKIVYRFNATHEWILWGESNKLEAKEEKLFCESHFSRAFCGKNEQLEVKAIQQVWLEIE